MELPIRSYSPLRAARGRHHITQQELAELAGVSQSFISNLEAGLSILDDRILGALRTLGEDTKRLKRRHRKHMAAMARLARRQTPAALPAPCSSRPKKE